MLSNQKLSVIWLIIAAFLLFVFELLSLSGVKLSTIELPFVFGAIILIIGFPVLVDAGKALIRLNFRNIHCLALFSVLAAFCLNKYPESAIIMVFFSLSKRLQDNQEAKSEKSLETIFGKIPQYAYLKGMDEPIDVKSLKIGQVIAVKPHHTIPLDGVIVSGESLVDESLIYGTDSPREKKQGDLVFAGTHNRQGTLFVKVLRVSENSVLAQIKNQMMKTLPCQAESELFIEKISFIYTPAILLFSLFWLMGSLVSGKTFGQAISDALILLSIGAPSALLLAAPFSRFWAIQKAALQKMIIKSGQAFESLGKAKVLAFDKMNILTDNKGFVRKEASVLMVKLKKIGVIPALVTGDESLSAERLAKDIGIKMVKSDLLPQDKVEVIQELIKKYAIVAMVGDGIHNSAALGRAQASLSPISEQEDDTKKTASILIFGDLLNRIPSAIELARQMLAVIQLNRILAIGIKALCLFLALVGAIGLTAATAIELSIVLLLFFLPLLTMKKE